MYRMIMNRRTIMTESKTFARWLREQSGREDGTGEAARAWAADETKGNIHSVTGVLKHMSEHPDTWASEIRAKMDAAIGEWRRSRGLNSADGPGAETPPASPETAQDPLPGMPGPGGVPPAPPQAAQAAAGDDPVQQEPASKRELLARHPGRTGQVPGYQPPAPEEPAFAPGGLVPGEFQPGTKVIMEWQPMLGPVAITVGVIATIRAQAVTLSTETGSWVVVPWQRIGHIVPRRPEIELPALAGRMSFPASPSAPETAQNAAYALGAPADPGEAVARAAQRAEAAVDRVLGRPGPAEIAAAHGDADRQAIERTHAAEEHHAAGQYRPPGQQGMPDYDWRRMYETADHDAEVQ